MKTLKPSVASTLGGSRGKDQGAPSASATGGRHPTASPVHPVNYCSTDQKWNADLSYVWTYEGWLYLAVVLDLLARRVVGWAVSDRLHQDLAVRRCVRLWRSGDVSRCGSVGDLPQGPALASSILWGRHRLEGP